MLSLLRQPFPYRRQPWITILIASMSIFFVLAIFQPFGLSQLSNDKWFRIAGFTLITAFITFLCTFLFPLIFKKFYSIDNWTLGKYLLSTSAIILLIAIGNFMFDWNISGRYPVTLSSLLSYLLITFLVGIIPTILITFFIQNYTLRQNLKEAKILNKKLLSRVSEDKDKSTEYNIVTLTGSTKEKISLPANDILYIESSANYVKINYLDEDKIVKQVSLRTTIAQIEMMLESYPYIQRCHRAFLINTSQIINVEGNTQGFLLNLKHITNEIPVSRSYTKQIKQILSTNIL